MAKREQDTDTVGFEILAGIDTTTAPHRIGGDGNLAVLTSNLYPMSPGQISSVPNFSTIYTAVVGTTIVGIWSYGAGVILMETSALTTILRAVNLSTGISVVIYDYGGIVSGIPQAVVGYIASVLSGTNSQSYGAFYVSAKGFPVIRVLQDETTGAFAVLASTFLGAGPIAVYSERLYAVYNSKPNVLHGSPVNSDDLVIAGGQDFNFVIGGPITTIVTGPYESATIGPLNWMFIFKSSSIAIMTGPDPVNDRKSEVVTRIGTWSPKSVALVPEGIIFLGWFDNAPYSIYLLDNSFKMKEIGYELRPIIQAAGSNASDAVGSYTRNREYRLAIKDNVYGAGSVSGYWMDMLAGVDKKAWWGLMNAYANLKFYTNYRASLVANVQILPIYSDGASLAKEVTSPAGSNWEIRTKLFDGGFNDIAIRSISFTAYASSAGNVSIYFYGQGVAQTLIETIGITTTPQGYTVIPSPDNTLQGRLIGVSMQGSNTIDPKILNMKMEFVRKGRETG